MRPHPWTISGDERENRWGVLTNQSINSIDLEKLNTIKIIWLTKNFGIKFFPVLTSYEWCSGVFRLTIIREDGTIDMTTMYVYFGGSEECEACAQYINIPQKQQNNSVYIIYFCFDFKFRVVNKSQGGRWFARWYGANHPLLHAWSMYTKKTKQTKTIC